MANAGNAPSEPGSRPVADRVAAELRADVARLEADNARLRRLLALTAREATPPGPAQAGWFEAHPGGVDAGSPVEAKVAFYAAMFAARTDVYATRWENVRTGKAGWLPAVRGGWRKGVPHGSRTTFPHLGGPCRAPDG